MKRLTVDLWDDGDMHFRYASYRHPSEAKGSKECEGSNSNIRITGHLLEHIRSFMLLQSGSISE